MERTMWIEPVGDSRIPPDKRVVQQVEERAFVVRGNPQPAMIEAIHEVDRYLKGEPK